MSQNDHLVSKAIEIQQNTLENSQRALTQAMELPVRQTIELQKNAAELFLDGLEMTTWMGNRNADLTRDAFTTYIDTVEDTQELAEQGIRDATTAGQQTLQAGQGVTGNGFHPEQSPALGPQQPVGQQQPQQPAGQVQPGTPQPPVQPPQGPQTQQPVGEPHQPIGQAQQPVRGRQQPVGQPQQPIGQAQQPVGQIHRPVGQVQPQPSGGTGGQQRPATGTGGQGASQQYGAPAPAYAPPQQGTPSYPQQGAPSYQQSAGRSAPAATGPTRQTEQRQGAEPPAPEENRNVSEGESEPAEVPAENT